MAHCCIVKTGDHIGLLLVKDEGLWQVQGFKSEMDGIRYFEDSYNRFHRRGYEASMSALINSITFQPSIVQTPLEEIEPYMIEKRATTVRNVSGSMTIILLKPEAEKLWAQGAKPNLISH